MTEPAISISSLVRTFGTTRALDGLSMTVERGEVRGFLGPNGSGKSTTIRILLGLIRATSGRARVLSMDPWTDSVQIHRRISYVAGDVSLWPTLTGGETIDLLTRHHTGREKRRAELIDRFEFDPTKKTRAYSKGNRQKVALISALTADAELYLFDEPTSGLDPLMEAVFTDEVRKLKEQGKTVLLSSHILAEVEKLCDSVTIIRAGQAIESGTLPELRHLTRSTVTAAIAADPGPLSALPAVHDLVADGSRVSFRVDDAEISSVLPMLAQLEARSVTINPASLEELFLRHYGDESRLS